MKRFIFLLMILAGSFCYALEFEDNVYIPYSEEQIEYQAELLAQQAGHVSEEKSVMFSTSTIDWVKNTFSSDVSLDFIKAGLPMPSGKASGVTTIQMRLPLLIKDPILSTYIDNSRTLGDLVLDHEFTLEELTLIIQNANQKPAVFANGGQNLLESHTIDMYEIGGKLVKHKTPYTQKQPVKRVSSRKYSGIVIDARGSLPVHGEFLNDRMNPCFFPQVWTEEMDLVYERNMVEPEIVTKNGIVHYSSSSYIEDYAQYVGKDPLWINAKKVFGINRTDPLIAEKDYLKITSVRENMDLLRQGKVVILLDDDLLHHKVLVPEKNKQYYVAYQRTRRYFYENRVPDVVLNDALTGIQITMQNLRFLPDSPELLPDERPRIAQIAESLRRITSSGEFTILVEGHTADLNKPKGQLELSLQRTQTIINTLIEDGVNKDIFTYRGYGATRPLASNETREGRAQNRRVEITVMPKASYILRE